MDINRLAQLATEALTLPIGCGDPYFGSLQDQECWAPYLRFMYLCVKEYSPASVVELGVYAGTCTGHMAMANPKIPIIGVDREFKPEAYEIRKRFPNIHLIEGDTVESMPTVKWLLEYTSIGMIFLDSTHDGITARNELEAYRPLFADECIVAVDDLLGPVHLMEKMQEFWKTLPDEKIELNFLHPIPDDRINLIDQPGFGVAIVRK